MAVQKQSGQFTDQGTSVVDLTKKENLLCKRDATGGIVLAGAGDYCAGVISQGRPIGKHTSFNTFQNPILRVIAGAAVALGARVNSDAQGRAVAGAANSIGTARNAAAAAGEVIAIVCDPQS